MGVILQPQPQVWACPNCSVRERSAGQVNRFHPCSGMGGLDAPLVLEGADVRVRTVLREDYVGGDLVAADQFGRPVSAIVTERPDGSNDVLVLAPCARGGGVA